MISIYADHGYSPNIALEPREQNTTAALISSGMGISIVPSCMKALSVPNITHIDIIGIKQRTSIAVLHLYPHLRSSKILLIAAMKY